MAISRPKIECGCCFQKKIERDFETVHGYGGGDKYVCADCARWMKDEVTRLNQGEGKS
jgi:hypothetical protein